MSVPAEHLILLEIKTWRSYGVDGQGPTVDTLIKDLSDQHLVNIIHHLARNFKTDGILSESMEIMQNELAWRMRDFWQPLV